jgi:hypothetical protein
VNPLPPCWIQTDRTRYFSLARHALAAALRAAGIGAGARILLPEFICRDVLAAVTAAGATPCWYATQADLTPAADPNTWPQAAAVIAVNYFGFAQDLAAFRRYTSRTGALLIEDNAHGFLSRDPDGQWLGCRADIGLFSFRKTVSRLNGAACVIAGEEIRARLPAQLPEGTAPRIGGARLKHALRRLPWCGPRLAGIATAAARNLRCLRTGNALPASAADAESTIPGPAAPPDGLINDLAGHAATEEIARRRRLFEKFLALANHAGVAVVYDALPAGTVPYGFAFRNSGAIEPLRREAARCGLDVLPWPDLPAAIQPSAPAHYRDLWLINFLW